MSGHDDEALPEPVVPSGAEGQARAMLAQDRLAQDMLAQDMLVGRGIALRLMELAGALSIVGGLLCAPCGRPQVERVGRVGLAALLLLLVPMVPSGLAELWRGRALGPKPRALTQMAQSLAFSYALVCIWMDLAVSHPMRLLVGELVRARAPAVGRFLEDFGTSVAIGGVGLFVLGWMLGESGRSRQAIPKMGSALVMGLAYAIHTRGLAARTLAGEWLSVEGLVLFPAVALALIQLYAGTRKFSEDAEVLGTPGLAPVLLFAPLSGFVCAFGALAEPITGAAAGSRFARALIAVGPVVAPLAIGWAQARTAPALGGEPLLDAPLYRGLCVLGVTCAALAYF